MAGDCAVDDEVFGVNSDRNGVGAAFCRPCFYISFSKEAAGEACRRIQLAFCFSEVCLLRMQGVFLWL